MYVLAIVINNKYGSYDTYITFIMNILVKFGDRVQILWSLIDNANMQFFFSISLV